MTVVTAHQRDRPAEIRGRSAQAREAMANARRAQTAAHQAKEPQAEAAATWRSSPQGRPLVPRLESQALCQIAGLNSYTATDRCSMTSPRCRPWSSWPARRCRLVRWLSVRRLAPLTSSHDRVRARWGPAADGRAVPHRRSARFEPDMYSGVIRAATTAAEPSRPDPDHAGRFAVVEYMQEGAAVSGSPSSFDTAAETAEGAMKPQADLNLGEARRTSGRSRIGSSSSRQQIAGRAGPRHADQHPLDIRRPSRVESQILSRQRDGENSGHRRDNRCRRRAPTTRAELAADQALEGVVDVLLPEALPNAVILNPSDWADLGRRKRMGQASRVRTTRPALRSTAQQLWDSRDPVDRSRGRHGAGW